MTLRTMDLYDVDLLREECESRHFHIVPEREKLRDLSQQFEWRVGMTHVRFRRMMERIRGGA